jgi:hypothetical protein
MGQVEGYAPESFIGWLDYDAAATERANTLLRSLEEPGTLDALGLGRVRDAFADLLSPGTSTIQTRLRYFLFVPWILSSLESERVRPAEFGRRLRDREALLIECLRSVGPGEGVIGYSAGRDLKRMPSEIYWGGLESWGIRRFDLTITQYGQSAAALNRLASERDDDGNPTDSAPSMWAGLPGPPEDFLDADADFDLREQEAEFLVDSIRRRHPDSMLAALCSKPDVASGVGLPWELPPGTLPDHLDEVMHHARCFSEITVGPQHLYNVLVAREAREEFKWDTERVETTELANLDAWAQEIAARERVLSDWVEDLAELWRYLDRFDQIPAATRRFIESVAAHAINGADTFAENRELAQLILDREVDLKRKRARLANRSALEAWNGAAFGGRLNYRWPITQSYLADVHLAREQG